MNFKVVGTPDFSSFRSLYFEERKENVDFSNLGMAPMLHANQSKDQVIFEYIEM